MHSSIKNLLGVPKLLIPLLPALSVWIIDNALARGMSPQGDPSRAARWQCLAIKAGVGTTGGPAVKVSHLPHGSHSFTSGCSFGCLGSLQLISDDILCRAENSHPLSHSGGVSSPRSNLDIFRNLGIDLSDCDGGSGVGFEFAPCDDRPAFDELPEDIVVAGAQVDNAR